MKRIHPAGLSPARLVASSLLLVASAHAAFTWNETGAMLYDGTVDANPFDFGAGIDGDNDISIRNGGSLTVQNGTLNLQPNTPWGDKIGQTSAGSVTVNAGGILNWQVDNDNEDRLMVGNGTNGNATITLNGGSFNVTGPGGYDNLERNVRFGADNGVATVNLNAGTLDVQAAIPVAFAGKWTAGGTSFTSSSGASTMTVTNGWFKVSGTGPFDVGNNGTINYLAGGTGGLSLNGWTQAQFEALVTAGKIKKNGNTATAEDFIYTLNGAQGEYRLDNSSLLPPAIVTQPAFFVDGVVGGSVNIVAVASGNPAPALLWEVSTDNGGTWTSTGVTTSTLALTGLTHAMDGYRYRLVADNNVEPNATSDESTLFVSYPDPAISAQPVSVTGAPAGGSASFSVTASGIGTLAYQWQKSSDAGQSWADVSGAIADTLTIDPVAHTDAALYRCVITDPAPLADSLPATTTHSNWAYLGLSNDSAGFVWAPVNSIMTYDGTGADAGINPYTQFGNDIAIGFGNGSSSELTVGSGTLSIVNVDQWSLKIAQNHVNGHTGTGVVNVSPGATLNLGDTGAGGAIASTEQRVVIGARANGTLNVNGGTVNIHVGPGGDALRSFQVGGSGDAGYTGTLNLNAGTLNYPSDAPIRIGPAAGAGVVNVNNGQLRATGTGSLQFGGNDHINFTVGGTGSIALLGWNSAADPGYTQFKALIDAGYIRANGVVVPAGSYEAAIFSDDGELGVMKINPAYVASPYLGWANANAGGQGADLDHDGDGVKNGIEFFLNVAAGFTANPSVSGGSVVWPNGGNIAVTGYGSQFKVQTSEDLAGWNDVLESDPALSNTAGSVTYTLPAGSGKLFVRLLVTPN